jgi:phosphoribosylanthranilate isomerase
MPPPPERLRIKICGQTTLADAELSVAAGADMIGVILFRGSKRFVPMPAVAEWIDRVPRGIERVAVFVDPTLEEVREALADDRFHTAQLHGRETPEFLHTLNASGFAGRLIKALRVVDESSLAALESYPTRRFLLDGPDPGSGRTFDWSLAATAVARHPDATFLLAGGLTAENVAAGIRSVRPQGVDVASGVESRPGVKDAVRLRDFISAVRRPPPH